MAQKNNVLMEKKGDQVNDQRFLLMLYVCYRIERDLQWINIGQKLICFAKNMWPNDRKDDLND